MSTTEENCDGDSGTGTVFRGASGHLGRFRPPFATASQFKPRAADPYAARQFALQIALQMALQVTLKVILRVAVRVTVRATAQVAAKVTFRVIPSVAL
jgi:hypothetical protein